MRKATTARKRAKARETKQISPKLKSGDSRLAVYHGLPEEVKEGLRAIAHKENKSIAWVLEECIIDYFGLRAPSYKGQATIKSFQPIRLVARR